jgi:hypothetical protein
LIPWQYSYTSGRKFQCFQFGFLGKSNIKQNNPTKKEIENLTDLLTFPQDRHILKGKRKDSGRAGARSGI